MKTVKDLCKEFLKINHEDENEIQSFTNGLCKDMIVEMKRIMCLRNSFEDKKTLNVMKELDHKWRMFAKRVTTESPFIIIPEDGLLTYIKIKYPELYLSYEIRKIQQCNIQPSH